MNFIFEPVTQKERIHRGECVMNKIDKVKNALKQACVRLLVLGAAAFLIFFALKNIFDLDIEFASTKLLVAVSFGMAAVLALVCALLSFIKRKE